jgi:hypothetical protein
VSLAIQGLDASELKLDDYAVMELYEEAPHARTNTNDVETTTELLMRAEAYGNELYALRPARHEDRLESEDAMYLAWRRAARAAIENYQAIAALREQIAKKVARADQLKAIVKMDRGYEPVEVRRARARGSMVTRMINSPAEAASRRGLVAVWHLLNRAKFIHIPTRVPIQLRRHFDAPNLFIDAFQV